MENALTITSSPAEIERLRQELAEHKQAELLLRQRELELKSLIENTSDLIARFDRQFRCVCVNPAIEQATGLSSRQCLGKTVRELGMGGAWCDVLEMKLSEAFTGQREVRFEFQDTSARSTRHYCCRLVPQPAAGGSAESVMAIARDITRFRQAEESLRLNEARLRQIIDLVPHFIFAKDQDGRLLLANKAQADAYGMTVEQLVGRNHAELHRDEAEVRHMLQDDQEVIRSGKPKHIPQETFVCSDGSRRVLETIKIPFTASGMNAPSMLGVAVDITDRKRAEEAFRRSEERWQLAVAATQDGIYDWQPETNELFWSGRMWDMLGYVEGEIDAGVETFNRLLHPADYERTWEAIRRHLEGATSLYQTEFRLRHKDGSYRWILSRGKAIFDGKGSPVRMVGTHTDITDHKQAEEALARRTRSLKLLAESATRLLLHEQPKELMRALFDELATHLGLEVYFNYLVTDDGKRLRLNACTGVDEEVCRSLEQLEFGKEVCGMVAQRRVRWVVEDVQHSTEPNIGLIRRLGITAYACHPLLAQGRLVGTLSFGSRVRTSFNPDELEVLQAVANQIALALERQRLLSELERRAEDLTAANTAKDRFLAVLSHELRTPLTPVLAMAQMMEVDSTLSPGHRESIQMIHRNVELEARLIDDLLDLTRISRGKLELHFSTVDLHEKLRQVVEICESDIRSKQLRLTAELNAPNPLVEADAARLQQVLWNLVKNAVKFTPPGGEITIRTESRNGRIAISVKDSGVGIAAELLPRLFSAFEQGGRDVTRQFGGLGLGLVISKGLVELHGGTLIAHSEGKGKGATFTMELDTSLGNGTACSRMHRGAGAETRRRGGRLLLVEDHVDTARTLALLLRGDGFDVRVAHDVASALQAAEAERFDLLISDIGLPDGSGLDLMRQLRMKYSTKGIALSGFGMEDDVRRSLEAGFAVHLTKPINLETLEEALRQVAG